MALMICPDCKNEVSDTAEICMNCGCDLFLYKESIRLDKEIESKVKAYESSIKMPKQVDSLSQVHSYRNEETAVGFIPIFAGIFIFLGIILMFMDNSEAIPFGIFFVLFGGGFIYVYFHLKNNAKKLLSEEQNRIQSAIDNFENNKKRQVEYYRNSLIAEKNKELEKIKERNTKIIDEEPKGIHCPMCKSTDYEKISTLSRVVSVELVGLASSKIGKQYKCKKCGHLW